MRDSRARRFTAPAHLPSALVTQDAPCFEFYPSVGDVVRHADDGVHEGYEFLDLDRLGVRGENDVLIVHLHPRSKEIPGWINKAHRINDWHRRPIHLRAVDPELFGKRARFTPVKEDRTWIGRQIEQSAGSPDGLSKRHPPSRRKVIKLAASTEWKLALDARGTERQVRLWLLVEIDRIAGPGPDIIARLIDQ